MIIAVTVPTKSPLDRIRVRGGFHEIMAYIKSKHGMQRPKKTV